MTENVRSYALQLIASRGQGRDGMPLLRHETN